MRARGSLCLILVGFDTPPKSHESRKEGVEKGKASQSPEMLSFDLTFSVKLTVGRLCWNKVIFMHSISQYPSIK